MTVSKRRKQLALFSGRGDGQHNGPGRKTADRKVKDVLRFTGLRLKNWRNFVSVDLELQQRAFLVGPNASGKSNLLDVFGFLHDIVSIGGGFQAAVEKRGGVSALRCLAARQHSDIKIEVDVGTTDEPRLWGYTVVISQDNQRKAVLRQERVTSKGEEILIRPDEQDLIDTKRLTQTHLEQLNVNREYRDIAGFFASVRYLHVVPQLVREPDRSVGKRNDPFGGDLLEQIAGTNKRIQQSRLRRIEQALRIAVPQLEKLDIDKDVRGVPHLKGKYQHWRPRGAWQREDQFSDGTLRLLGLLWALLDGSGPLLLEEPELSLHPEVIHHLPQMFWRMQRRTGRQILLSSHSPDLLFDEGIGLDEVLLLQPSRDGTLVRPAKAFEDVVQLVVEGSPLAEAILPHTRPEKASQLALFGEERTGRRKE